jgi:aryl carrier-like protein
MVPSTFVLLDALPLTPNGKLDRAALPAPSSERPEQVAGYLAPRNEIEGKLVAAWQEVLGVQPVGVEDNMFELGADSMRVIQLVVRCQEVGLGVTVQDLYRAQSISALVSSARRAELVEQASTAEPFALLGEEDRSGLARLKRAATEDPG